MNSIHLCAGDFRAASLMRENHPKACVRERNIKNNNKFGIFSIVIPLLILLLAKDILIFIIPLSFVENNNKNKRYESYELDIRI